MSGLCQRCSEPFDWSEHEACPHCGWEKAAWVDGGRYDLRGPDVWGT